MGFVKFLIHACCAWKALALRRKASHGFDGNAARGEAVPLQQRGAQPRALQRRPTNVNHGEQIVHAGHEAQPLARLVAAGPTTPRENGRPSPDHGVREGRRELRECV